MRSRRSGCEEYVMRILSSAWSPVTSRLVRWSRRRRASGDHRECVREHALRVFGSSARLASMAWCNATGMSCRVLGVSILRRERGQMRLLVGNKRAYRGDRPKAMGLWPQTNLPVNRSRLTDQRGTMESLRHRPLCARDMARMQCMNDSR
ncbi:hypothetical protein BD309DRAFT_445726 [Dichomitus squalens]|nr:hypothetical protein BD309DRAFT_445726 [Dichomitus squalens]